MSRMRERGVKFEKESRAWKTGKMDLLLTKMRNHKWDTFGSEQDFSTGYVHVILIRCQVGISNMWVQNSGKNSVFVSHLHIDDSKAMKLYEISMWNEYIERRRVKGWPLEYSNAKTWRSKQKKKCIQWGRREKSSVVFLSSSEEGFKG